MPPSPFPARLRIPQAVLIQDLDGEAIVVNVTSLQRARLNEMGVLAWQLLTETGDTAKVVRAMSETYDVAEERLKNDLAVLFAGLLDRGLLEVAEP